MSLKFERYYSVQTFFYQANTCYSSQVCQIRIVRREFCHVTKLPLKMQTLILIDILYGIALDDFKGNVDFISYCFL